MPRLDRRTFLKATTASLMAAPIVRAQPAPDVVVVGAGAFGGWTALHLREMGHRVALLDAYGPGNGRAASGGETRQIRVGYGDQEIYSRWVLRALEKWKAREEEFGQSLMLKTGRLQLASSWTTELRATKSAFEKLGVVHEVVPHDELSKRHPQMRPEGVEFALFEPGAGVLRARHAMQVVAGAFERKGGRVAIGRAEPPSGAGSTLSRISLSGGDGLSAAAYVFACGPWLPKVFPDLLGDKIFTPRRDTFFFGTPAGDFDSTILICPTSRTRVTTASPTSTAGASSYVPRENRWPSTPISMNGSITAICRSGRGPFSRIVSPTSRINPSSKAAYARRR